MWLSSEAHAGFVQVMENLESHGIYHFNIQAWKVMEFYYFNFQAWKLKSWKLGEGHGKSWKVICRSEKKKPSR